MSPLYIAIGVGVAIILLVLLFRYGSKASLKKVEWYAHWGQRLRLNHSSEKYMLARLNALSGNLEQHPVKIYEKITGNDNNSQYLHTFIEFEPSPFDFDFEIGRKKNLRTPPTSLGDAELDAQFYFLSADLDSLCKLINSEAKNILLEIGNDLGTGIICKKGKFEYSQMGGPTTEDQIEDLNRILSFMRTLIKNKS